MLYLQKKKQKKFEKNIMEKLGNTLQKCIASYARISASTMLIRELYSIFFFV